VGVAEGLQALSVVITDHSFSPAHASGAWESRNRRLPLERPGTAVYARKLPKKMPVSGGG